jgi:hypothetical protein
MINLILNFKNKLRRYNLELMTETSGSLLMMILSIGYSFTDQLFAAQFSAKALFIHNSLINISKNVEQNLNLI